MTSSVMIIWGIDPKPFFDRYKFTHGYLSQLAKQKGMSIRVASYSYNSQPTTYQIVREGFYKLKEYTPQELLLELNKEKTDD